MPSDSATRNKIKTPCCRVRSAIFSPVPVKKYKRHAKCRCKALAKWARGEMCRGPSVTKTSSFSSYYAMHHRKPLESHRSHQLRTARMLSLPSLWPS
jgi:hypothetical protein